MAMAMARSSRRRGAASTANGGAASSTPSHRGRNARSAATDEDVEETLGEEDVVTKSDTSAQAASAAATAAAAVEMMQDTNGSTSSDGIGDDEDVVMTNGDDSDDERKMPASKSSDEESESESDDSSSDDDGEDDNASANNDNNDGLSEYERLRLERIKRNQERLAALGLLDVKEQVRQQQAAAKKKKKYKKKDRDAASAPQRILPKRQARDRASLTAEQLNPFDVRKMRISSDPSYYERRSNSGAASMDKYRRTYRCGDCQGCNWTEDCGQCVWCIGRVNNPTRQRRCLMKICRNRLVDTTVDEMEGGAGTDDNGEGEAAAAAEQEEEEEGGARSKTITVTVGELVRKNRIKMPPNMGVQASLSSAPATGTSVDTAAADGDGDGEEKKEEEEEEEDNEDDKKMPSDGTTLTKSDPATDNGEPKKGDGTPILFPESCFACKEDGILFCCDTCPRGFHSDCHFPKIRDLPVGDWQCIECVRAANGGDGGGDVAVAEKAPDIHAVLPAGFDLEEHLTRSGKKRGAASPKRGRKYTSKTPEVVAVGGISGESAEPGKTVKVTIHEPRARCVACTEFGDIDEEAAILCRACDQYFHKDCQTLENKRGGRWRCDACQTAKASVWYDLLAVIPEEGDKKDEEDEKNISVAAGTKTIRVSVVGPETKCVECSQDGSGGEDMVWCRACDNSFHLGCHSPPLQTIPKGRWKCGMCKIANIPLPRPPKPKNKTKDEILASLKLFKGEHDDDCYICYNGGDLVCCDFCSKAYHMQCHIPPLPFLPDENLLWKCCECSAVERTKKSRCGECKACLRKPCGKCAHCLNGRTKKVCIKKVCPYPRFAPPASSTSIPGLINIRVPLDGDDEDEQESPIKSGGKKRGRLPANDSDGPGGKKKRRKDHYDSDGDDDMEEESEDEWGGGPITFKLKLNSLKSAFMDPESVKIRKIINSARRNAKDSKACDKACEHLRKHLSSTENLEKIILWRGIEMICDAMREHPEKTIVQAEACCTLAEMIWLDPTISTKLAHEGAIELIATCMNRFTTNLKVQQMGSGAFRALTYDEASVPFIRDADGLAAVLSSMKNNPNKLLVQREACYFLQNMLVHENETADAISKSRVVPIIADAMANEHADAEFIQSVCGLIANLALNKRAKAAIGKSGAIPCIIDALNSSEDLDVKQAACSALKHLALESSDNQKKISEAGGLDAVLSAVKSFSDDEVLLIAAFGALKELCIKDEASSRKLVSKGIVKILLKAMKDNQDLAIMQSAACGLIGYLPYGKRDKEAPKLAELIIAAMKAHGDVSYVQVEGCDALVELAQVCTVIPILKEKSTVKVLQKAKKEYEECLSDVEDIMAATKKK